MVCISSFFSGESYCCLSFIRIFGSAILTIMKNCFRMVNVGFMVCVRRLSLAYFNWTVSVWLS